MINVYYAVKSPTAKAEGIFDTNPLLTMLDEGLIPVYNDLQKNKNKNIENVSSMFSCRSFLQYTKNMYLMKNPHDLDVRIEKNKVLNFGNRYFDHLYVNRVLQVNDAYNLNYEPGYIFFCEQSLEVEILSPFMHKSNFCKNGYIVPGSYDISKWFRPLNPALQLYDNFDKHIISEKGDPLMYINFRTKDTVTLKKFVMNQELEDIVYAAATYKRYDENRPLDYIYNKFLGAGLHNKTLKLIKENLI